MTLNAAAGHRPSEVSSPELLHEVVICSADAFGRHWAGNVRSLSRPYSLRRMSRSPRVAKSEALSICS